MKKTDADGAVSFASRERTGNSFHLLAKKGAHVTFDGQQVGFYRQGSAGSRTASLLYTDRSIYRPGQKLYWKVLAYEGSQEDARFKSAAQTPVTVWLVDPNGERVETRSVSTNAFGTAAGEFVVPTGRLLGGWRLESLALGQRAGEDRGVQAADVRGHLPGAEGTDAPQPEGHPDRGGEVLLRPSGRVRQRDVARHARDAPAVVVVLLGLGLAVEGPDGGVRLDRPRGRRDVPGRLHPRGRRDRREGERPDVALRRERRRRRRGRRDAQRDPLRAGSGSSPSRRASASRLASSREKEPASATITRSSLDGTPRAGKGSWRLVALVPPATTSLPADLPRRGAPADGEDRAPEGAPYATPGDSLRPRWDTSFNVEGVLRDFRDGDEKARGEAVHGSTASQSSTSGGSTPARGGFATRRSTTSVRSTRRSGTSSWPVGGRHPRSRSSSSWNRGRSGWGRRHVSSRRRAFLVSRCSSSGSARERSSRARS